MSALICRDEHHAIGISVQNRCICRQPRDTELDDLLCRWADTYRVWIGGGCAI